MEKGIVKAGVASYRPAEITADFGAMRERLAELMAPYEGMTEEALMALDTKEVKACRADVNRIIKDVEDGRKAVKRAYNEPLKAFEAQVAELLAPAHEAADMLASVVNSKETKERELRLEGLRNTYQDCAPALAEVVPFERILEENTAWANKSYGAAKAADEIIERTAKLAKDWATLQAMQNGIAQYEVVEREFFRTLDISASIDAGKRAEEEQARIDALKAEREEIAEYQQGEQELERFTFTVECTRAQRDRIIGYLKGQGIHGKVEREVA